jgi:hypothetical protein
MTTISPLEKEGRGEIYFDTPISHVQRNFRDTTLG